MKKTILSWLLHHANREGRNEHFYKIKNRMLSTYGKQVGYDVQFIEGKECHACGGTGTYTGYYWESGNPWYEACYRCYNGWYKRPTWNILHRVQFGKYIFHQPFQRVYKKPEISTPIIEGYIEHTRSKYGKISLHILFLIYEKGYLTRYWRQSGNGWCFQWWLPSNWVYNLIHLVKRKSKAIPVIRMKMKISNLFGKKHPVQGSKINSDYEELPF